MKIGMGTGKFSVWGNKDEKPLHLSLDATVHVPRSCIRGLMEPRGTQDNLYNIRTGLCRGCGSSRDGKKVLTAARWK